MLKVSLELIKNSLLFVLRVGSSCNVKNGKSGSRLLRLLKSGHFISVRRQILTNYSKLHTNIIAPIKTEQFY